MNFRSAHEGNVFKKVVAELPGIISKKCDGYDELYGYKLVPDEPNSERKFYDKEIAECLIYKFCKGYQFHYEIVVEHIVNVLNWRREFNPLSAAFKEVHNKELVEVGILASYPNHESNKKVVTWNIYGQLIKKKYLFKDGEKFLRYRIGLMERGLRLLDFKDDTNNYMTQVHDYKGVSVLSMDSDMKKVVREIVLVFQSYYPELLYAKYFINVPSFLRWIYDVIKTFVDENTKKKFVVLSDGRKMAHYLKDVPSTNYGGSDTNTLQQENITNVRPTEYGLYILEKQANEDID
ncbi:hypothetical protein KAFR_0F01910 [Kazachstania africana CBS 2517]|uniref:Phosphatidylinositol transfer protein SFH5 n=1 Tax=Kazachstania africana (strain ATCC 22294 / BCRC 22015 / CBS 2517 / CECT 1963 / NBRC 1671 / NRRL Y-8276) TaxID=1071382 RepID=H2AWN8_KAZAF|nr:hypothetical protein KAFR_0F01910 [Kazachstania africana CBS 2517]CCF58788.1 hypothetical protein KAFR_0F01910 [Kazachstania africana CBS 2517]